MVLVDRWLSHMISSKNCQLPSLPAMDQSRKPSSDQAQAIGSHGIFKPCVMNMKYWSENKRDDTDDTQETVAPWA